MEKYVIFKGHVLMPIYKYLAKYLKVVKNT
jgi:hypothetical protein